MTKPKDKAAPIGDDVASWDRYGPAPRTCPICGESYTTSTVVATCGDPECAAEYERRYNRGHYKKNAAHIMANQKARVGSRATPPKKRYCEAPHPTKLGKLCGKKFEATGRGKGRRRTCSEECRVRLRNAQQVERYRKDPQAKRDYKNSHYAENYAVLPGTTHCPNPACRREYIKRRSNQHTCGRQACHTWLRSNKRPKPIRMVDCKYCKDKFEHAIGKAPYACPKEECQEAHRARGRVKASAWATEDYHKKHPGAHKFTPDHRAKISAGVRRAISAKRRR
jgi:hypothetical protein